MKKRILALFLLLCMFFSFLPFTGYAEETEGRIVFNGSAPDKNGYFTMKMTFYNVTFRVFQFALRYDPAAIVPVNENGDATDKFENFTLIDSDVTWLSEVGSAINREAGLIDFSGYVTPGDRDSRINSYGEIALGNEGQEIYTFMFRSLKSETPKLEIATEEKGEPYRAACPEGVIIAGENGNVPVKISFVMKDTAGTESQSAVNSNPKSTGSTATPPKKPTANELLDASVILKIGSHAAVVKSGVTAIYPGEQNVSAYINADRTFVPVRFVAERMGATVDWDNKTGTVVIEKDGKIIHMTVGELSYTLNDAVYPMDAPAEFSKEASGYVRTMVPVRFVAKALGYNVEWDSVRGMVIISNSTLVWTLSDETAQEALTKAQELLAMYSMFV